MDAPTLSLIAPLYNEAPNLPRLLKACAAALERTGESWEILLIDDGSDDGSWACIEEAMRADRRVRGLRHPQRLGKTQAYATGFRAARGQYLFTLDADLQEDPAAIPTMLERLRTDADMVVGWRRRRRDPLPKVLASRAFNAALRWGLRLPLHDANCGFKGMRREVADALLPHLERDFHRYLALMAHRLGFRVAEVVVAHRPRAYGRSRYGLERYGRALADLWAVLRRLRRR
jgi:glycosyltransferase involved in cell wall biosynthesis